MGNDYLMTSGIQALAFACQDSGVSNHTFVLLGKYCEGICAMGYLGSPCNLWELLGVILFGARRNGDSSFLILCLCLILLWDQG